MNWEKLFPINNIGQTDRVTTPTRAELRRWPRPRHTARLAALEQLLTTR